MISTKNKERFKQISIWTLVNGFFLFCLYLGTIHNMKEFTNVGIFIGWFTGILGCSLFIKSIRDEAVKSRTAPSYINKKVDNTLDVLITIIFAANGYIILAFVYLLHIYAINLFKDDLDNKFSNPE